MLHVKSKLGDGVTCNIGQRKSGRFYAHTCGYSIPNILCAWNHMKNRTCEQWFHLKYATFEMLISFFSVTNHNQIGMADGYNVHCSRSKGTLPKG